MTHQPLTPTAPPPFDPYLTLLRSRIMVVIDGLNEVALLTLRTVNGELAEDPDESISFAYYMTMKKRWEWFLRALPTLPANLIRAWYDDPRDIRDLLASTERIASKDRKGNTVSEALELVFYQANAPSISVEHLQTIYDHALFANSNSTPTLTLTPIKEPTP